MEMKCSRCGNIDVVEAINIKKKMVVDLHSVLVKSAMLVAYHSHLMI